MAGLLLISCMVLILAAGAHPLPGNFYGHGTGITCSSFRSVPIRAGYRACRGFVGVDCRLLEDTRDDIAEEIEAWFMAGVCDVNAQEEAATRLTDSVGIVWGRALARVNCRQGFGCGFAIDDGRRWGFLFAKIFTESANKILKTGKYPGLEHFCALDLQDVEEVLADMSQQALFEVCRAGGSEEAYHTDFSRLSKSYALATLKKAASGICGSLSMESKCNPAKERMAEVVLIPASHWDRQDYLEG